MEEHLAGGKRPGAHLLRHEVTEVVAAAAATHFGSDRPAAALSIWQLRQPELRHFFSLIYGAPTSSGNNDWMRGKLLQAVGMDARWRPPVMEDQRVPDTHKTNSDSATASPSHAQRQSRRRRPSVLLDDSSGSEGAAACEPGHSARQQAPSASRKRSRELARPEGSQPAAPAAAPAQTPIIILAANPGPVVAGLPAQASQPGPAPGDSQPTGLSSSLQAAASQAWHQQTHTPPASFPLLQQLHSLGSSPAALALAALAGQLAPPAAPTLPAWPLAQQLQSWPPQLWGNMAASQPNTAMASQLLHALLPPAVQSSAPAPQPCQQLQLVPSLQPGAAQLNNLLSALQLAGLGSQQQPQPQQSDAAAAALARLVILTAALGVQGQQQVPSGMLPAPAAASIILPPNTQPGAFSSLQHHAPPAGAPSLAASVAILAAAGLAAPAWQQGAS